jgi:DNA-binding MurR/RpiR family transcriptional regulator
MSILDQLRQSALEGSPAIRKVGLWMAAHPLRAISLSADEIAQQAHASQSAVNRFATHAGFAGFMELRAALAAQLHDAQEPIAKLSQQADISAEHPFASAQAGLLQAAGELDLETLAQCAQRLLEADNVYTLGLGMSHYAAGFAASALMPYVQGATHLSEGGGTEQILRRMSRLGVGDVVLVISVPRYSMDIVTLARCAAERGAHVVGLTDQASAPLAGVAQSVLLAPAEHGVLSHSYVSIVAVIEALLVQVVRLNPQSAAITTDLMESMLPHLQVRARERS